jgi:hypothetical protein
MVYSNQLCSSNSLVSDQTDSLEACAQQVLDLAADAQCSAGNGYFAFSPSTKAC